MNRTIDAAPNAVEPWRRLALACTFAFSSVRSNTRRVTLAAVGVAIGIAAVSSMLVIGHSVTAQAERTLAGMGGDIVTLSFTQSGNEHTPSDTAAVSAAVAGTDAMAARAELLLLTMPEVSASARVESLPPCSVSSELPLARLDLMSASPRLQQALSLKMAKGRFLYDIDGARGWVVLGSEAARELTPGGPVLGPGTAIEVCGKTLHVAGVLAPYDGDDLLPTIKVNSALIVLPALAARLGMAGTAPQLLVRARDNTSEIDLGQLLSQRLSAASVEPVTAVGARRFAEMKHQQVALYTRFLAMLGAVSLIVGSLGVANVMLVSVTERRAEIGLRAAIGARPADIALQFVLESLLICLGGSLAGFLLGLAGSASALALAHIELSIGTGTLVAVAVLVLTSGLAAGLYPALRAARLDPAVTLQGG